MNFWDDFGKFSSAIALRAGPSEYLTYADLVHLSDKISLVVKERRVAFLLCRNLPEVIAAYLGMLRANTVPLLLGEAISQEHFDRLFRIYQPEYLFLPEDRTGLCPEGREIERLYSYRLLKCKNGAENKIYEDLSLLLLTSGSLGSPKTVRLSAKNLQSNAVAISDCLGISPEDSAITTLPLNYAYGLSILHSHLERGASLVLNQHSVLELGFWKTLRSSRATSMGGIPWTYQAMERLGLENLQAPHLRKLTQAGGRLAPEKVLHFARFCQETNRDFFVMYGQTEATARIACLRGDQALIRPQSVGRPIPGGKAWIANGEINLAAPEQEGELIYQGSNVCLGYAESAFDLGKADDFQGVLRTGDIATIDRDGHLYLKGRVGREVKIFGQRLNLEGLEALALEKGRELACAECAGKIVVFVTNRKDINKFRDIFSGESGLPLHAFRWLIVKRIPRGDSGKILYSQLKAE